MANETPRTKAAIKYFYRENESPHHIPYIEVEEYKKLELELRDAKYPNPKNMPHNKYSLEELQNLWIEIWFEMFNIVVEEDETMETATVLQEFVRRVTTA